MLYTNSNAPVGLEDSPYASQGRRHIRPMTGGCGQLRALLIYGEREAILDRQAERRL